MRLRPDHGLDAFNVLLAAAMTGFGAFIPAYLSVHAWTQAEIGLALTVQTAAGLVLQIPAGAAVDATRRRRTLLGTAVLVVALAAFILAVLPLRWPVALALVLQASVSGLIYPSVAAISLAMVGRDGLSVRLGRNASFSAIGSGLGAALMGGAATWLGEREVFVLAGLMGLAAVAALGLTAGTAKRGRRAPIAGEARQHVPIVLLLRDRRVLTFGLCVVLFNLSSAALMPIAAAEVTRRLGPSSGMLIAAWIIIPQMIVAVFSPLAGRFAERFGRRPVLIAGFATLPLRGLLFALVGNPYALAGVQALDGIAGATFGVMTPLLANDLTRGTNRASLCLALFGLAGTFGAGASTSLAGYTATRLGIQIAYLLMAGAGVLAVATVFLALPEPRKPVGHA